MAQKATKTRRKHISISKFRFHSQSREATEVTGLRPSQAGESPPCCYSPASLSSCHLEPQVPPPREGSWPPCMSLTALPGPPNLAVCWRGQWEIWLPRHTSPCPQGAVFSLAPCGTRSLGVPSGERGRRMLSERLRQKNDVITQGVGFWEALSPGTCFSISSAGWKRRFLSRPRICRVRFFTGRVLWNCVLHPSVASDPLHSENLAFEVTRAQAQGHNPQIGLLAWEGTSGRYGDLAL